MRTGIGIFLAAGAAYSFSFALDLLLGGVTGVYPMTVYLPVVTWSVIATVVLLIAYKVAASSRWLALPFGGLGALALFGALVGNHPHSYGVAAILLIQALIILRLGPRHDSVRSNAEGPTRRTFDDQQTQQFVDAISHMLEIQAVAAGNRPIEHPPGNVNSRALGYIYGFIDAALRTIGQDMGDQSIGVPITFQVLRRLFPGQEERYCRYLIERVATDQQVMLAALTGGQQYIDFNNGKLASPMGLARYILDTE